VKYLLILLIFSLREGAPSVPVVPIVAEFNTLQACWDANSTIVDPLRRDDQWQVTTSARCVAKGREDYDQ
jgi:hypothetical protein